MTAPDLRAPSCSAAPAIARGSNTGGGGGSRLLALLSSRAVLPPMPAATDQATTTRRTSLLNFRVLPAEREQLLQLAASRGTTLSDLIRQGLQAQGF